MREEQWILGGATAKVRRMQHLTLIELHGVVTAPAYEALHLRMAMEPAEALFIVLSDTAFITATNRSLAEAAARGTPSRERRCVTLIVRPLRLAWAKRHCLFMAEASLMRRASVAPG